MEGDRGGEEEDDNDDDPNRAAVFEPPRYGNRPEWATRRAIVLFLSETHLTVSINGADNLVNDLMEILNLLTVNVKEVANLRPEEVHTIDRKGREAVLITAKTQMNVFVSRVMGYTVGPFLAEIVANRSKVAGIKLLQIFFRNEFGGNTNADSAVFGPQVPTFVTDLLRPIVVFFRDQLQQGIDDLPIEQASRAISDLAGLVRLAPLPSNPKNTAIILNGHLQMAASHMPGFVRGGLNSVNLLRVFYFGLVGSENHEKGKPFPSELDQTIRSEVIDFFRSDYMAGANLMVGN